jgi:hypothetical protein
VFLEVDGAEAAEFLQALARILATLMRATLILPLRDFRAGLLERGLAPGCDERSRARSRTKRSEQDRPSS